MIKIVDLRNQLKVTATVNTLYQCTILSILTFDIHDDYNREIMNIMVSMAIVF